MLSNETIVRAWRDAKFRAQVSGNVPANPAGSGQLAASELGGENYLTTPICTELGPRCEQLGSGG